MIMTFDSSYLLSILIFISVFKTQTPKMRKIKIYLYSKMPILNYMISNKSYYISISKL